MYGVRASRSMGRRLGIVRMSSDSCGLDDCDGGGVEEVVVEGVGVDEGRAGCDRASEVEVNVRRKRELVRVKEGEMARKRDCGC